MDDNDNSEINILNPYNQNNNLITKDILKDIFRKLDLNISPNNINYYI